MLLFKGEMQVGVIAVAMEVVVEGANAVKILDLVTKQLPWNGQGMTVIDNIQIKIAFKFLLVLKSTYMKKENMVQFAC